MILRFVYNATNRLWKFVFWRKAGRSGSVSLYYTNPCSTRYQSCRICREISIEFSCWNSRLRSRLTKVYATISCEHFGSFHAHVERCVEFRHLIFVIFFLTLVYTCSLYTYWYTCFLHVYIVFASCVHKIANRFCSTRSF